MSKRDDDANRLILSYKNSFNNTYTNVTELYLWFDIQIITIN
jgi:hypothetical protein